MSHSISIIDVPGRPVMTTLTQTGTIDIDDEEPRALAVSPDGSTVYAAIFQSGNGSTILGGAATPPPPEISPTP